jgi:hypothetical protein
MKNLKKMIIPVSPLAFSLLLTGIAAAGTVNIPEEQPSISVNIPDSWKPEATEKGIACESPDKVAMVLFEVTSSTEADALISENAEWLTRDQGVELDAASEQKQDLKDAGLQWKCIYWSGTSREWGPATVGLMFTDAGHGHVLRVTYWISKKDQERHIPVLAAILDSVKLVSLSPK